jgi:pimeloyl-ACP methyl ester carboxylesterase
MGGVTRHERMTADGVELHVARAGNGPPVLLLHGFPEHWRSWRHQIPVLASAGFSVLAPDLRGYNDSDRPASVGAYHLRHLVADVAALVRATGHARAHVVGHDWGGIVAWTFAGIHPELVQSVVIMNAPHLDIYVRALRRSSQMLRSWYVLFFRMPWLPEHALSAGNFAAVRRMFRLHGSRMPFSEAEIEINVAALSRPGALTAALNYYRANMAADAIDLARAARVEADTLVIWGERDPALAVGLLNGLDRVAPHVEVHRIAHASHWVQSEVPDEVNRLLVPFLQSRTPSTSKEIPRDAAARHR